MVQLQETKGKIVGHVHDEQNMTAHITANIVGKLTVVGRKKMQKDEQPNKFTWEISLNIESVEQFQIALLHII